MVCRGSDNDYSQSPQVTQTFTPNTLALCLRWRQTLWTKVYSALVYISLNHSYLSTPHLPYPGVHNHLHKFSSTTQENLYFFFHDLLATINTLYISLTTTLHMKSIYLKLWGDHGPSRLEGCAAELDLSRGLFSLFPINNSLHTTLQHSQNHPPAQSHEKFWSIPSKADHITQM